MSDALAPLPRPVPLQLPTPARRDLRRRAMRIGRVVLRHMGGIAAKRALGRPIATSAFARPLRLTFEELGATFIKFAQLTASAPGIFGEAVANEFRSSLDTGPAVPFAAVRAAVEDTLGGPLENTFAAFDEPPIGCASIAVVHRARLRNGRAVAVKVLRPHIEETAATDLALLTPLLEFLARRVGVPEAGQLVRLADGFREQLAEELDLRNEARAMAYYRRVVEVLELPSIVIPAPFPELSGQRVLVMEFLDGIPIDDLARIAEFGLDPRPLLTQLIRAWFTTALRDGTFHGDVHAGNLLLLRDGRVGVVDWGIVGQLDAHTHRFLRRTIEAALGDENAWNDVAADLIGAYGPALREGLGLSDPEIARFVRGATEPLLVRPFGEVSLGAFLAAMQGQVAEAEGRVVARRSFRDRLRRLRRQRRMHVGIESHGGRGTSFDRGNFLLAKQLLYFERYGKMFLGDQSILGDRAFFERILAAAPLSAPPASLAPW